MKGWQVLLALLLCDCLLVAWTVPSAFDVMDSCCFHLEKKKVRLPRVKSYRTTPKKCTKAAVVFVTFRDKELCMDPSQKHVQNIMKAISKRGQWKNKKRNRSRN